MHHIIWALNTDQGSLSDTVAHLVNHAHEQLGMHGVDLHVQVPEDLPDVQLSPVMRRNLFLVIKEALHNVVKHAGASAVHIVIGHDEGLHIEVRDNGSARGASSPERRGHGLANMRERMTGMGGCFRIDQDQGTRIILDLPLS
jgi:signal transduction histidine kinase